MHVRLWSSFGVYMCISVSVCRPVPTKRFDWFWFIFFKLKESVIIQQSWFSRSKVIQFFCWKIDLRIFYRADLEYGDVLISIYDFCLFIIVIYLTGILCFVSGNFYVIQVATPRMRNRTTGYHILFNSWLFENM